MRQTAELVPPALKSYMPYSRANWRFPNFAENFFWQVNSITSSFLLIVSLYVMRTRKVESSDEITSNQINEIKTINEIAL